MEMVPLHMPPAAEQAGSQQLQHLAESLRAEKPGQQAEELRKAAREFEGYFIAYLMKEMRATVPKGLIENKAGDQFYSFYDQEIGRLAAEAGGIGLARMLEIELSRQQGSGNSPQVLAGENR